MAFLVDQQTAGRGTRGKTWESPLGWTYLSIAFPPLQKDALSLPLQIAEVVCEVLSSANPETQFWVKPPNDIYRKNEKIAGILLEQSRDALVVGIGIDYPADDLASQVVTAIETFYRGWVPL